MEEEEVKAARKNISLQILQDEVEEEESSEPDETTKDLLQEFEDFQYPSENEYSFDFSKKENKTQMTTPKVPLSFSSKESGMMSINQFFTPYTKNEDSSGKLEDLELENNLLKIEVKELKEKFSHLEYLVYNRLASQPGGGGDINTLNSSFWPSTLYDRLQTKVKELESEVKKMKEEIEIIDSNHCQLGEHVDLIQLEIDKINEDFGAEDEYYNDK